MKKYNIFIALAIVATLVGCNKDINTTTEEWGDVNIPLDPSKHYIHFDADVSTRGALIEGTILQDDFRVFGYQYPGLWEAESVLASPNVFDANPQLVEHQNGVFSYGTPKVWTGNRYSFFGYYPANHSNIKYFDNDVVQKGTPYITYTLPDDNDPTKLIDVMTASYIDTGVASSASVPMQFHHRLSAIDVGARNYYEYDHDNNKATAPKLVTIEITKLIVYLTNVVNTSAKIYLDHTIPSVYPENQPKASKVYAMVNINTPWAVSSFDVVPNTKEDRAIRLVTTQTGENASSILLIPQTEFLHGAIELVYKKKYFVDENNNGIQDFVDNNGNEKYDEGDELIEKWEYIHEGTNTEDFEFSPTDLNINFSKQLIEGRRYYIELTFTSDAVSVNIIAADEWDDKDDIRHEFE